jgi:hypothetical protein
MERYKNLGGDSGVAAYELAATSITVQFHDGAVYLYTDASAGRDAIQTMKELAIAGQGLNEYINRYVRKKYERKIR